MNSVLLSILNQFKVTSEGCWSPPGSKGVAGHREWLQLGMSLQLAPVEAPPITNNGSAIFLKPVAFSSTDKVERKTLFSLSWRFNLIFKNGIKYHVFP
jgi:hypothetical protein